MREFGIGTVQLHTLYVHYIMYCQSNGFRNQSCICTDKEFSKCLQGVGFIKKRMKTGMCFIIG